jgi:DNA-binding transcriptional LysR family regulator
MMNDPGVDPRRLELLLELSRLGSMREVGESMHVTTSTVSQQIAALAQEAGTQLTEPHGRRVRLTPAGQRLAGHAVTILAALEAARLDLDPAAAPAGTVRVAAFATAVRESVLPVVRLLAERHPAVLLHIHEHEPDEALGLLADDAVDLALTYDYNLAPARFDRSLVTQPLGLRQWGLGTPTAQGRVAGTALEVFRRFADHDWIVNSRNSGDEDVIRTVASLAGFQPRITHRVDSLELVQDMILAGLGVGLLAAGRPVRRGVVLRTLGQPAVTQRPFAVTRRGRSAWAPLALVLQLLGEISGLTARRINGELRASPARWRARSWRAVTVNHRTFVRWSSGREICAGRRIGSPTESVGIYEPRARRLSVPALRHRDGPRAEPCSGRRPLTCVSLAGPRGGPGLPGRGRAGLDPLQPGRCAAPSRLVSTSSLERCRSSGDRRHSRQRRWRRGILRTPRAAAGRPPAESADAISRAVSAGARTTSPKPCSGSHFERSPVPPGYCFCWTAART